MPILFPAIDLKNGECVRLKLGDMNQATVYNADPAAQARAFEAEGFDHLHVVDLDGAFAGAAVNGAAVERILAAVGGRMKVQLGGGIRTLADAERWLALGLHRVILGTVAVEGWAQASELTALDLARRFVDAGVAAIVYTDIDRDGILAGINWAATIELAEAVPIPVIASGGLASMDDIRRLAEADAAILEGAITGRALYDGRIDAGQALALLRRPA